MSDGQSQKAGDHGTAIQAGRDVHIGITVTEARQIALDVFKANALELAGVARDLFEARGREFIERYLEELQRHRPEALESFRDPDMQYAVFIAQREYARSGCENLEQVLLDLLVERSTAVSLQRIVLNEAIGIAGKLTAAQLDTLSFLLLFVHDAPLRYTFHRLEDFGAYLRQYVTPVLNETIVDASTFQHLKYVGCASMDSGGRSIVDRIQHVFPACFAEGFHGLEQDPPVARLHDYIIPSFHTESAYQFLPMDSNTFRARCAERGLTEEQSDLLYSLQVMRMLDPFRSREILRQRDERFALLTEASPVTAITLGDVQLTTVGIALANANLRRKTGLEFDLGIWIK